ncbi:penicillin-binding protein 1B [Psychromonas sp. psych-6C06]|uniref:penicillin-binding protein 1B n=1 Tax=Psychromonas sp. psych-6C06 TaxID=2058089 RepID=UPI000C320177|nr:penicillin-binding protein 1B [Psychromonas sp. psych-6C06]PKF61285.1 penicillin-binding protein 1B [Psychromonas sp. psych-6C06]
MPQIKKTVTKKNTIKKTPAKKSAKKRKNAKNTTKASIGQRLLSFIWGFFWKSTLAFVAFMVIAGIYFDKKIERKLDGSTWTLPAQIYARPLTIEPLQLLSPNALISELKMLNYRPVRVVNSAGQFSVKGERVTIYRRTFDFPDGFIGKDKLAITFTKGIVKSIKNSQGQLLERVKLEPLLLSRLHSDQIEDRVFVPFERIPDLFIDTLLLMEDRNYYHHQGISPLAIVRAFIVNFKAGYTVQGGSTLTQQLAKNLFLTQERSLWRKFQEAYIAVLMDYKYSKDKLLEAYLNEVYLAQNGKSGVYGIGLASDFYFARPINELRIEQIALLVAIIKGPSYYNPRRNPERALARRDLVLRMMVEKGLINSNDYKYAVSDPLSLSDRTALNHRANPAFISFLHRELKRQVPAAVRKQSGLHIFTSIDPVAQQGAEFAVQKGLALVDKKQPASLQGAMVISDREAAELRAIVSGRDVKFSGFNRALDANRPIGSLVKPAVYLTALEQGYQLQDKLDDKQIVLKNSTGQRWQPNNYDRKFRGSVSVEEALYKSLNVPTVNLGMKVGLGNVIDTLHKLGIQEKIKAYPSLVLGSVSLSPFEVAQMYQPITTQGRYQPLQMIRSIVAKEGELLYQRDQSSEQRFSTVAVNQLTNTLSKVTSEGTARSLRWRNPGQSFAGKTGTTNNLKDSWFVGFDSEEVVTTWVGRDDNKSAELTGSSGALVLFSQYMKQKNN